MTVSNCRINIILTWREHFIIPKGNKVTILATANTKLHFLIVTLSTDLLIQIHQNQVDKA